MSTNADSSQSSKDELIECYYCAVTIKEEDLFKHIFVIHQFSKKKKLKKKEKIYLISKSGKKIPGKHKCADCGIEHYNLVKYTESNMRPVVLCKTCNSNIRSKSFGTKKNDALDYAETGGGFEDNRRRH